MPTISFVGTVSTVQENEDIVGTVSTVQEKEDIVGTVSTVQKKEGKAYTLPLQVIYGFLRLR